MLEQWGKIAAMRDMDQTMADGAFAPVIEGADAPGRVIVVCEHASNHIPSAWGDLGLREDQRRAHIAWDPGALGLARGLLGFDDDAIGIIDQHVGRLAACQRFGR